MSTNTIQRIPTGTYQLDPVHSSIAFGVRFNGLAMFRSTFDVVQAELVDGVLSGAADVGSIRIDEPHFKGHLLAEDFFNADVAPTLSFRSTDIRPSEGGQAVVDGELTIRGVSRPVTASGTYAVGTDLRGGERAAFSLATTLDRRDFGLEWQMPLPDGSDALDWNVTVSVELQLVKQDS
jgi:polyisoprenoid-binding protein YceI